jgi:hypothetical protein
MALLLDNFNGSFTSQDSEHRISRYDPKDEKYNSEQNENHWKGKNYPCYYIALQ